MNQGLHHLPDGLWEQPGALEHVQLIDVSKNCLTTLPARLLFWVGGLKKLDASQNCLTELPVRCPRGPPSTCIAPCHTLFQTPLPPVGVHLFRSCTVDPGSGSWGHKASSWS